MGSVEQQPPVHLMNRRMRRAQMRRTGHTWASARRLAKEQEQEREAALAAKASKLTPEEARKALGEWAARGGK